MKEILEHIIKKINEIPLASEVFVGTYGNHELVHAVTDACCEVVEDEINKLSEQSEQKEPCGWCKENYRFEFNWIDEDGNTVTTDDHMVIGGIADYCPVCGRHLNQPYTES